MWHHLSSNPVPASVQNEHVIELLQAILEELRSNKVPTRLWSLDDIAAYINRSKITVQQRVACKPDFPKAVRIPTSAGKLGPLWYQDEVKAYIKRHQGRTRAK